MNQPKTTNGPRVLLPHRLLGNIYVQELGKAYCALGCEVVFGPENLYESNFEPDIVHVNWPEELYRSIGSGSYERRAKRMFDVLDKLKARGSQLAWTVHNEKPHEQFENDIDAEIYQAVIDRADILHHHCNCSLDKLDAKYRGVREKKHFIAPHGHYFAYRNDVTRAEARSRLNLERDSYVYLHFGAIRNYKGIDMVLDAFGRVRRKGDVLLVAGRMSGARKLRERLKLAFHKYVGSTVRFHLETIDSDDIQLYVNSADALVLGHTDGLNSGVAVLGMSFGSLVVGPRLGCIESVLNQGMNLTYETGNLSELTEKMRIARELSAADVFRMNRESAQTWQWTGIAGPVLDCISA